ncbi:hypothetical protein Pan153_28650 [Gimesia panareensis]|uniref:Uncharacterized protein n=1 Tax=Gimesia panareensis TaxID=2527978 RepID=A0A518FPC8_9PLAN|nr:hypothetical protein [Gimesia panareensis]QDV18208.1 hypothetical protein Pan153_28650 [Gimesia panareensis]
MKTSYCLYDILDKIEKQPAMYVGEPILKNTFLFLIGYEMAMIDAGVENATEPEFSDFHEFVRQKLFFSDSSAGWARMILAVAAGYDPRQITWEDLEQLFPPEVHRESLRLFFQLLKEFRSATDFEPDADTF